MDRSIAQTACKVVEEILKAIEEVGFSRIGETADKLIDVLKEGTLDLLSAGISAMDEGILSAKKERRADGITVKARNVPREIMTALGPLHYQRTYFQLKDGSKAYLTDYLIGVESYERITKELIANLLQLSADMSMQKAADSLGTPVTRQTIDNRLLSMKQVGIEIEREEETPQELHLFADEDHAHLRNPKSSVMVPLITETEGIDITDPKRHRTIHPIHFEGYGMDHDAFLENVMAATYQRYDMEQVEKVYIHGDAGQWIRKLLAVFPNSVFVMDEFHLEKYLKALIRLPNARKYACAIRAAISNDDFSSFVRYCSLIAETLEEKDRKTLTELIHYFENNWESIVERKKKVVCGSCTEALVGHTLSKRLSRNPLGWSRDGLAKMSMLRVFTRNGGKVRATDIRVSRTKEDRKQDRELLKDGLAVYNRYAEEQVKTVFGKAHDWSIFESKRVTYGKVTGTSVLLNACARMRDSFSLS